MILRYTTFLSAKYAYKYSMAIFLLLPIYNHILKYERDVMKKRVNKLIALFLTVSLSATSLVYADDVTEAAGTEVSSEESSESASTESTEENTEEEDAVSENETESTEEPTEETSENSVSDDTELTTESTDSETVDVAAVEESIEEQFLNSDDLVYDTDLTISNVETAAVLADTASALSELKADEDYVSNEAMFTTDSEERAKVVAEEYGAELESYSDGVATLKFDTDVIDVFNTASDSLSSNVLLHPNYIASFDTVDSSDSSIAFEELELDTTASTQSLSGHNDTYISKQWFLDAISANEAWSVTKGSGVKVAVLDTGCDVTHEDLKSNIAETYSTVTGTTDVTDNVGHGTHCAGTIAASLDNGIGVAGVAPSAQLYIIQISRSTGISYSNIFKGINKAAELDVDVASMSFGGYISDSSTLAMLQNCLNNLRNNGTVLVVAAGNESTDTPSYPAACNNVLSIASAGYGMYASNTAYGHTYSPSDPELAWYSNYGSTVDLIAPGGSCLNNTYGSVDNLSTVPSNYTDTGYLTSGYAYMAGTSMACPVAAGVAALVFAANPDLIDNNTASAVEAVENKLLASTDGKTYNNYRINSSVDTGCINAYKAVSGTAEISAVRVARADGTILTNNTTVYIDKGKSEKLKLVGKDGKVLKSSVTKTANWSSSSSDISVKKGKLKVSKSATVGNSSTISVSCNDTSININFVTIDKVKNILYQKTSRKVSNKFTTTASVNGSIAISDLPTVVGQSVYAITKVTKSGLRRTYSGYDVNLIGYNITGNKKVMSMISGGVFTPTKKGNYKVKYVLNDGSKKTFTVTFKVK